MANLEANPFGLHRVRDNPKVLPQNAQCLDNNTPIAKNEVLVEVEFLQIDSASFHQLKSAFPDEAGLKNQVLSIIKERGKMQNPVTGSGGMLLGRIKEVGSAYPDKSLKVGDAIATLISLTATPLKIETIEAVDLARERLKVKGHAILFARSLYAKMPADIPTGAALAAFDICGAPKLTVNHVKRGDSIFVLGLGKAGRSVVAALIKEFGDEVTICGADAGEASVDFCKKNYARKNNQFEILNARDPVAVMTWADAKTGGKYFDLTANMVNVANTEMPTILATRDGGKCLFFSMATDFQKATLGAEASAKDVTLIMGTGYTAGHADYMINLVRSDKVLKDYFEKNFG